MPLFTLIGATTEEGGLETPFFNRFPLHFKLEPYTEEELEKIASNAIVKSNCTAPPEAVSAIALMFEGVARVALNFVTTCSNYALPQEQQAGGYRQGYNGPLRPSRIPICASMVGPYAR